MAGQTPASRMPGSWLLAIARVVFNESVLTSVVHQTIADLRDEWLRAGTALSGRAIARGRGYLAFWSLVLMAPFAFRKWPGRKIDRRAFWQIRGGFDMAFIRRFRLVSTLLILGLGTGYAVARLRPDMYRSSAIIQLTPASVEAVGESGLMSTERLASRLRTHSEFILSRTRLEHLIEDFDLYQSERQSMIMEDVIALMRRRLAVDAKSTDQVVISFTGSNPVTTMKVTERAASYFIEQGMKDRQRRIEGTVSFLEARIEETGNRLAVVSDELERAKAAQRLPKRLELEVTETTYKNLLMRREEALATQDLERRQMGEQFVLIDAAQVPEAPIGPTKFQVTLMGGAAGLVAAALIALATSLRRMLRSRRGDLARATP